MSATLIPIDGLLLGRARVPGWDFPRIVTVRDGRVIDITAAGAATSRDICERPEPAAYVATDIRCIERTIWHVLDNFLVYMSPPTANRRF